MTRKKRKRQRKMVLTPCFVFTPETITLAEKAIALFEAALGRAHHQKKKVAFAEETILEVKAKLANMKQSVGETLLTTFDYNEKVVITQALRMYSLDLLSMPPGTKRDRELRQCRHISSGLSVATKSPT
ncbi:MAG TPA: hypothetical protein VFN35_16200 [Ktedonobacteraceae bacterium]|nr:hypothetical protein [Ktedonobacteraceae bacterium]